MAKKQTVRKTAAVRFAPHFEPNREFGYSVAIVTDENGKLWRLDPQAGTVSEVKRA